MVTALPQEPGIWFMPVVGAEPLHIAATLLEEATVWTRQRLLQGDAARVPVAVLVPDAGARQALLTPAPAVSGRPGVAPVSKSVWTPSTLYRAIDSQHPPDVLDTALLVEAGRAVDAAIREVPEAFPWLSAAPPGATMPRAYATLAADLGSAAAHSRSPGTVAALQRLNPDGLGQELLRALGMMEGAIDRLGLPPRWTLGHGAADALSKPDQTPDWTAPESLIVAGFSGMEQALVDILRSLAPATAVTILVPGPRPPEGSGLDRALRWLGAAALPEWRPSDAGPLPGRRFSTPGPPEACEMAAALAEEAGVARSVVLVPAADRWRPLLQEVCGRRGWYLAGGVGATPRGWPLRFVVHLVRALELGLSASRAVDLVRLGTLLRLGPTAWEPPFVEGLTRPRRRRGRRAAAREPWDRLDARLRARGVRRDHAVIARVGGDVAGAVARVFERLEAAEGPSEQLAALAEICRDMGFWRRCLSAPALVAGRETAELARFATGADDLADRMKRVWPAGMTPRQGYDVLRARVDDLVRDVEMGRAWRAPPDGESAIEALRIQSLHDPLPRGTARVILLGLTEDAVRAAGRSGRVSALVPDGVRSHPDVASLIALPLARDRADTLDYRLGAMLDGDTGCQVDVVLPERDLMGEEVVPWSGLPDTPPPERWTHAGRASPLRPRAVPQPRPGERRPTIFDPHAGVAATVVDAYRACPRRFYFERLLRARDRDAVEFDIDSRQRGNWLHALMHRLFLDRPGWWREGLGPDDLVAALEGIRLRPRDRLVTGASDPFLRLQRRALVERAAERLVEHAELLREQAGPAARRRPGMAVVGLEIAMAAESSLPGLSLRGTMDRLDIAYDRRGRHLGTVVLDYKTGHLAPYGLAARDVPDARQERLQLLLYAHLVERVFQIPCLAALTVPLLDPGRPRGIVLADPRLPAAEAWAEAADPRDLVDKAGFDEAVGAALEETAAIVDAVDAGVFPAEPAHERECGFCPQSLYCERTRR